MKSFVAIIPPTAIVIFGLFLVSLTWFGMCVAVFGMIDAYGRYKDFQHLSKFPTLDSRMVKYYGKSYCGRWVVKTVDPIYAVAYDNLGYKWWHFMPDDFPRFLLKRRFYRNLVLGHRQS